MKQTHAADDKRPLPFFPLMKLWTLPLNNPLAAPPAFGAALGFFPLEGDLLAAYDITSGAQLWAKPVRTAVEPTAGHDQVFIVGPDAIVALNATDGAIAWEFPLSDPVAVPLAWRSGWLVAATTAGEVIALGDGDGHVAWRRTIGAAPHARPVASNDRVYVATTDSRVVALHGESGAPVWEHRLAKPANDILAIGRELYFGSQDNFFYGLDARTGDERWHWQTGADVVGKAAADAHTVFFVSLDNVLRANARSSGVQRWKAALPLRPASGPLEAFETLVVAGVAPSVQGYNARDGKSAGQLMIAGELAAPPSLVTSRSALFPILVAITSDVLGNATAVALTRDIEPSSLGAVTPLPGQILMTLPAGP